ncbi:MAG TPA: hypothetical protein VFU48_04605, partial [Nitrospira sp.]|nr:hypothetical protein [Nitrospira sp.]
MNLKSRPWRIRGVFFALLVVWLLVLDGNPQPIPQLKPKTDPVLGERIAEGVVLDGRLWLRGTLGKNALGDRSGGLVSFGIADQSRSVHFEKGVIALAKDGHNLWVLRQSSSNKHTFIVALWKSGRFEDVGEFKSPSKDLPLALLSNSGVVTVLTNETIRTLSPGHAWKSVPLKGKFRLGVQMAVASPTIGGNAYVGINRGEWGGGLQKVDLRTGDITNIERRDGKGLCDGPLNSDCDPVTGVIPDPQTKECVLASVGLVHLFTSEGRILRVCGEKVTIVSEKSVSPQNGNKRRMTEAFFGLAPAADDGYWAITWRALYRFDANGNQTGEYPLPKLQPVSGIYLSHDLPGALVVRTDVNWSVSTSGYTPLVIPLESSRP